MTCPKHTLHMVKLPSAYVVAAGGQATKPYHTDGPDSMLSPSEHRAPVAVHQWHTLLHIISCFGLVPLLCLTPYVDIKHATLAYMSYQ